MVLLVFHTQTVVFFIGVSSPFFLYISFSISPTISSELLLVMSSKSSAQSAEQVSKSSVFVVIGFCAEQISTEVV